MQRHDESLALVVKKLRLAYLRHGFEVDNYSFELELRSRFGDAAEAIKRFFDGSDDLPLGQVLRLCAVIGISPAQIVGEGDRDHLQIYDYLGGNPANVFLPYGLYFDRSVLDDTLFYLTAVSDLCEGISPGDLLVMSRLTLGPQPGQTFLIESDSALMLRVCVDPDGNFHHFARSPSSADDGLITIPLGKQTSSDETQGRPTLSGRLVWRIQAALT
ncbi:MAG: hypothetical protein ACRERX_13035 [Pseudomonas sp.]